jgi:hypothetical protein
MNTRKELQVRLIGSKGTTLDNRKPLCEGLCSWALKGSNREAGMLTHPTYKISINVMISKCKCKESTKFTK